jgi:hypothetical protein
MNEEPEGQQRKHKRLGLALALLVAILAVLIVPPLVSVSRYKAQITGLISTSLGRPVRLSSVELRLLPRPGFVLNNLTVEEDPAYGTEPVLHASTVTASIRLLSLWRGRLEIDSISLDEASLNLVRAAAGRWNLDPLLRTATAQAQLAAGNIAPGNQNKLIKLPYLTAKNSRINIKNGAEKLPFSLVDAEISLWQQSPGDWRVRLRGQPVRTDLSLEQADTGEVRMEANLRQAAELRQMPLHVDLEWREAQLGQLTRLLLGSDAGWRGDLTGELHLDGTAETAQIQARLRATSVHRAEFAPAAPLDFDANCTLTARFTTRSIDNLACDSPLGSGHIRLAGSLSGGLPEAGGQSHFSVELDRIPAAAGLDALRTVRSGLAPGLVAAGSVSGKITYAPAAPEKTASGEPTPFGHARPAKAHAAKPPALQEPPLTSSFTVADLELSGDGLGEPIRVSKLLLTPALASQQPGGALQPQALTATVAIPAGGAVPLTVSARLALSGYQVAVHGQASISRGRELAHMAGISNAAALDALAGAPVTVDLTAEGPWMPSPATASTPPAGGISPAAAAATGSGPSSAASADSLTGTVTLRNANWRADYLANPVEISQATLHLTPSELRWDPVVFSYGPVKGTASLLLPAACDAPQSCPPTFQVEFGALDASVLQAAFLGARKKGTLLSTLIDRLHPSAAPAWPLLEGTVKAKSLVLGPVTLRDPVATVRTFADGASMTAFNAGLLGGAVHGSGALHTASAAQAKPSYALEGQFAKLSPSAVGQLLGLRSTGGVFDGNGKVELTGFTGSDLAASAKGNLHFDWQHGKVAAASSLAPVPPALARFDLWSADAVIANGALTLKGNQIRRGSRTQPVQATVTLTDPPRSAFSASKLAPAKR